MPMQPPKPTVPTSLPMYFMVSNSAKHGTTCTHHTIITGPRGATNTSQEKVPGLQCSVLTDRATVLASKAAMESAEPN